MKKLILLSLIALSTIITKETEARCGYRSTYYSTYGYPEEYCYRNDFNSYPNWYYF